MESDEQEKGFRVTAYSGYQAEQEPRSLIVEGQRLDVVGIEDRWYDPLASYFKVRANDGRTYLLRYDLDDLGWSLVSVSESAE